MLLLVAHDRRLGVQAAQPAQPQAVQSSGHGGEGSGEQPGNVAQVQPLVPEVHSALQLLRIKRPPLGAPNTSSEPPEHLHRLSDSGPATCRRSAD